MNKKTALITGASGGIGRAVARVLAESHEVLVLHYFQNEATVSALKSELENKKQCHVSLVCADFTEPRSAAKSFTDWAGQIETLVHCSGVSAPRLFQEENPDSIEQQLAIGLTTPSVITRELAPEMIRNRTGSIIWITSVWGFGGASCEAVYSMVKSGQHGLIKALAKEFAPSNVRVNGVAPGAIDTEMLSVYTSEEKEAMAREIPAGRIGLPKDVAESVRFLVSDEAKYVNGHILTVDGAWHC